MLTKVSIYGFNMFTSSFLPKTSHTLTIVDTTLYITILDYVYMQFVAMH